MLKNITGAVSALLEGVETITEKSVGITTDGLDIIGEEMNIALEASRTTRAQKIELAIAEANHDLQKAKLKLTGKMSALQKLADKQN